MTQYVFAAIIVLALLAGIAQLRSIGNIVTRQADPETERSADVSMLPIAALIVAGLAVGMWRPQLRASMPEGGLLIGGLLIGAIVLPFLARGRGGALLVVLAFVAVGVVILGGQS